MKPNPTGQNVHPDILAAIDHVRTFFPEVCMVVFNAAGRWQYLTEDFERPNFKDADIDIGLLEDASNTAWPLPSVYQPYTFGE
jgi:hypothetical protein